MNLAKEKRVMLIAVKNASKVLQQHYGKKESVKVKPNKSLVATADLETNEAIIGTIKKYFPKHSILSEETGFEDNKSDFKWVIDPVDGTHNFLREIPIFGTSIGLEFQNKVVLGALHFPILQLTAIAEKNRGAFLNGKKIKVSGRKELEHSLISVDFAYSNRKEKTDFLRKLSGKAIDIRNFGAAIYHSLLVACGKCDGFVILSTHEWDIAAGFLLIEEAGGKITDLKGRKYALNQKQFVATNGKLHEKILAYLK